MHTEFGIMGMPGVGFIGMLIIGALAGWIAERAMNRDLSLLTNMLVGIAGSFVGGTLASIIGAQFYGFLGNLVVATIGAIIILWFFGRREAASHPPVQNQPGAMPPGGPMYHTKDGGPDARH